MAGERLLSRFSLRSQLWFRGSGKCFETATIHMQTVVHNINEPKQTNHINPRTALYSDRNLGLSEN
jgi:hypothetical protein